MVKKILSESRGVRLLMKLILGNICHCPNDYQKWYRNTYQPVALKVLKNSNNLSFDWLKEEVSLLLYLLYFII